MENDKKKAQNQVDKALAEVTRLKAVAKEIEESNKKAQKEHDFLVEKLQKKVEQTNDEVVIAEGTLSILKEQMNEDQKEVKNIKKSIQYLKSEHSNLDATVADKKSEISNIQIKIARMTESINERAIEKEGELRSLDIAIASMKKAYSDEESKQNISLQKLMRDIASKEEILKEKRSEVTTLNKEVKEKVKEASDAEYRCEVAEKKISELESKLVLLNEDIKAEQISFDATKKEADGVKEELKKLIAERISSKSFLDELQNKESNLKRKYADVGLEYK